MNTNVDVSECRRPWNKGKLAGQKAPLRISEIWAIRVRLEIFKRRRDLGLFNLAIDSKLRGCGLVQLVSRTFFMAITLPVERPSCSKKRNSRLSSSSRPARGRAWSIGLMP